MRSVRLFIALAVLVLVSSCASVGKIQTPSTKPEVTLENTSKKSAIDALVAWSATQGRQVVATTEYSITTTGQMDARASNNILWDISTVARTIYTPVVKGNNVTIYAQRFITFTEESNASNRYGAGSSPKGTTVSITTSHEKEEEYNSQRAYEEMQIELENFAQFAAQNK